MTTTGGDECEHVIQHQPEVTVQGSYRQELGDGVGLSAAHAAVTRPDDPPLAVGDGVRLLRALRPHRHHPPVVTRPRGQSLVREEVPLVQAGDPGGRLQDHLQHNGLIQSQMWFSGVDFVKYCGRWSNRIKTN